MLKGPGKKVRDSAKVEIAHVQDSESRLYIKTFSRKFIKSIC